MTEKQLFGRFPRLADCDPRRKEQLLKYLSPAPEGLLEHFSVEEIPADTVFVREGAPALWVYLVAKGSLNAVDYRICGVEYDFMQFAKVYALGAMEIIMERLEREYNLDLITTAPNVVYRITKTNGEVLEVYTPLNYPDPMEIEMSEEPFVKASILTPPEYVGNIMELCQQRRGEYRDMTYLDEGRVELRYFMPLNEIIYDFFDALKSRTRGYASLDYELDGYRQSKLVKLDILLNGDVVDALSFILFADNAYARARRICERLKENIPRQMFEIPVQAAIGGKIIARETIKALRKDVLAKCYGGDITRKKKLLEKQKEGKKRMRTFGTVSVPSEAFMAVLKLDE